MNPIADAKVSLTKIEEVLENWKQERARLERTRLLAELKSLESKTALTLQQLDPKGGVDIQTIQSAFNQASDYVEDIAKQIGEVDQVIVGVSRAIVQAVHKVCYLETELALSQALNKADKDLILEESCLTYTVIDGEAQLYPYNDRMAFEWKHTKRFGREMPPTPCH
jgi:hypothetical protein